jgi:arabinogalactan oligomer/maltooligosaccharide transport system permease protein
LAIVIKIAVLGVVLALAIYAIPLLIHYQMWMWLVVMSLATVSLFVIYTTKHFIPAKYLYPGSVFLCIFLVIPIILTVQYSMTNFGDGARGSKAETIESIVANSIKPSADSPFYNLAVAVESAGMVDSGPYTLFLTATGVTDPPVLFGVDGGEVATWTGEPATVTDGQVTGVPGYVLLTRPQINQQMAQISAIAVKVPGDDQAGIRIQGFQAYEGSASISYDAQQDALIDHATNPATVYPNQKIGDAYCFVDQAKGQCFQAQSWLQNVGAANYQRLLGDSGVRNQFLAAFGWTLIFAFGNVLICFLAGFLLAVTLNDDRIKGKKLWRSFLLLPYAVPALISLLMWSQFFNRDFGLVNRIFGANLDWLGDPTLAKVAIFIVQLWMGFPYMFIVCTGALQSIPSDVKEAARIDGASGIATTFRIILPLLLIAVAPLLVSSFAFNFNNFNAIKLLTDGGPSIPGQFLRGSTDILISMVYKRAFGGSGTELGFASAMSVLLFIITGVLAAAQFRLTKRLETIA